MTGESARSRNGSYYHYYSCAGRKSKQKNGCTKKRVSKDKIESAVIDLINNEVLTDEFIDEVILRVMKYQKSDSVSATIHNLEEQQKQIQKKLDNIMNAMESGVWSDTVNDRLHELEEQQKVIEQRIQHEKHAQVRFTADEIKRFLYALKRAEKTDSESQQYLINACINRIYLFDDDDGQRMIIHVNVSDQQTEPVTREYVVRIMTYSLHCFVHKRTLSETGDVLLSAMFRP